jgi:hypothetical protein
MAEWKVAKKVLKTVFLSVVGTVELKVAKMVERWVELLAGL